MKIKQLLNGAAICAMLAIPSALNAKDIKQFIMNGQSLSTGHQSWPVLSTQNIPGNYMMGKEIWINAGFGDDCCGKDYGYHGDKSWGLNNLVGTMSLACGQVEGNAHRDGGSVAECPLLGAVNHMQLTFMKGQNILATSVGVSGAAVEELSKECTQKQGKNYKQFAESLKHAVEETKNAGYEAISCPAIFWMQGEFNYQIKSEHAGLNAGEDNCTDTRTYKALMLKLKENMQKDIMEAYGQKTAPIWITYQTGGQYVRDKVSIGMAQLQAANENDDVIMAGSPYPYTDRGGHLDANGYRWFGEMLAKAYYKSSVLNERVIAMQPKKIIREDGGKTIRVKYYVPVGPMVFDTNLLPEITNYGFNVYHNGYGSSRKLNIKSITIDGDDIVMTFDQALTGKVIVTYGDPQAKIKNQPEGLNHLQGHGNLRDSDPYKSALTYIDLDEKKADGSYVYYRRASETRLRPDYEPKDENGDVIYGKPYPLYNFSVAFYYTLDKNVDELTILDDNNRPLPTVEREPGTLDVAYIDAVNGADTNDGSANAPFASFKKAVASVKWDGAKVIVNGLVNVDEELDLEGYKSLTIEGGDASACLDGKNASRIAETEKTNITLKGLKFANFSAIGYGGVFNLAGGSLTVEDCQFVNNGTERMKDDNGGVFSLTGCEYATIKNCSFENNIAFRGGAIYANNTKQLTVENSVFDGNKSIKNQDEKDNNSRGAALSVFGTNVDIDNCIFRNHESSNQCGVFQIGPAGIKDQHFTVKNSDILDNKAPKDHGGVLVAENSSQEKFTYNFINCTIAGNTAQGVGTVAWIQNDTNKSPTQQLNIYNCTITGNHNTSNKENSTVNLWESDIKTNIVNTILEGNTGGNNYEYSDLHAGEFTKEKSKNINIIRSVLGKFYAIRDEKTKGKERGVPTCDQYSQFNISPNKKADGEANYAGLLPRNENGTYIFKGLDANGIGMGSDELLVSKFNITTDRFGNKRTKNCIGSVELIDGVTGIGYITAKNKNLDIRRNGNSLIINSAHYGKGITLDVYTVAGERLTSLPVTSQVVTVSTSAIGKGIRIFRVNAPAASQTAVISL